jgi:hypothetical protein
MKVDTIYLKANSKFSEKISEWASQRAKEVITVSDKLLESFYFKIKPDIVHHITMKPIIYGSIAANILKINKKIKDREYS